MDINKAVDELSKKIGDTTYISTRDAKIIAGAARQQVTDKIEKLRVEITESRDKFGQIAERLWEIVNKKH